MNRSFFFPMKYIITFFVPLSIGSCSSEQGEKETSRAVAVRTQLVAYDNNVYPQEYVGTVEGEQAVDLSFLVGGNIEQMYLSEGQKVSKGRLLARLNTTSLKSAHALTLAALAQAQDAYKRLSAMYENKSLPEIQYIDVKTRLEQAQASEVMARKSLNDCNLYAHRSGVIGKRYLEPGATVMPGTPVYNVVDISSVNVKVAIPEREISGLATGSGCEVKISALGGESFGGKIIEKGVSAHPVSHTYDIKIKISNPTGKIMPGMVCRAYLGKAANTQKGSIVVPVRAVQVDHSDKRFVWVKDAQGKAARKEVILGNLSGNGVQITNGLQEGEELIVEGYQNISAGTLVAVKNK